MFKRGAIIVVLAALTGSACAVEPIFTRPGVDAGKSVTIDGYLKFGFENRNLYPSENWQSHQRRGECLPVGIRSANAALLAHATQFDGRKVTVTGTIDRLMQPDEINLSFCKDVGLIAEKIEAH